MDEADDRSPVRRRRAGGAVRRRQVVVRFSEAELGLIEAAAAEAELAVGAWIGEVAARVAAGDDGGVPVVWVDVVREVVRQRVELVAAVESLRALLVRLDAVLDRAVRESGP